MFQSVTSISEKLLFSSLEDNIKSFLDWGFLNIGGFVNVNIPTSGMSNGEFNLLKPSPDPTAKPGCVWEAVRKDWVCETGVSYKSSSPVTVSGIFVDNNFLPLPTDNSGPYYINYPLGQVVFSSPQRSTAKISVSYSYRYIQVYKSTDSIWWKELQQLSYDPNWSNTNKPDLVMVNHRVQMPTIIVENTARTIQIPYELGNVKNIMGQDILLHIFAENPTQLNSIIDILLLQKEKQAHLYNINKIIENNVSLLDYLGRKNINGLNYGQILSDPTYKSNVFYIHDASVSETNKISSSIYNGVVRWHIRIFPI
jgi:hypothetical protein